MTEIIRGLDEITDYSKNFTSDKEEFYDILSNIGEKDIITTFETKDNKKCVFASGFGENGEKEFLLYIDNSYLDILNDLHKRWVSYYIKKTVEETDIYDKGLNSLILLSAAIIAITNTNINDISNEELINGNKD